VGGLGEARAAVARDAAMSKDDGKIIFSVLEAENAERRLGRFWEEKFTTFPSVAPNAGCREK